MYSRLIKVISFFIPNRIWGILSEHFRVIKKNKLDTRYYLDNELSFIRFNRAYKSEPLAIEFIESMNEKSCFWDIGACIGTFSALACARGVKVIAFEANPFNLKVLYENMSLNNPKNGSLVVAICLSEHDQAIRLSGNRVSGNAIPIIDGDKSGLKYLVPALNLDFIGLDALERPSHIKIDVDGNELSVVTL